MSQSNKFNTTGFTPVPNNDPGLGSNSDFTPVPNNDPGLGSNSDFTPVPSNDPGLGNTDTNTGFKPVPSTDPGFGKPVSSFSEESFAQGYSKGFSQGFLQGFKKAASGEVQKMLELEKPGLNLGGFGSGGFQQQGFQPPKEGDTVGRDDDASAKVVEGAITAVDLDDALCSDL